MASQGPVLYQFHARGGKKRKTVEGWRAFQGENPLKVSFVHGYGGELVKTSGGTEPVLGRDRPWAQAAAGAHDRRSGSQKLQGHGRCFWANPGFSREPLTANTCGQIALTHLARPGDWVVVKNLKENCCTTDKQPGKPGSLPKVFILGKFTSEAADWYEPAAVSWCGFSNDGYAQGQRLAVREVEWLYCGSWAVLEREHPAVAKYLNQIGIPTVAMATKDGCVEALIKSSVRYDKSLMVPQATDERYPKDAYRKLVPSKANEASAAAASVTSKRGARKAELVEQAAGGSSSRRQRKQRRR